MSGAVVGLYCFARVINSTAIDDKVSQIGVHSGDGKLFEIARNGFV